MKYNIISGLESRFDTFKNILAKVSASNSLIMSNHVSFFTD
jgi:hypothetical protein